MEAGKRAPKLALTGLDMDIEHFHSGRRGVLQTPPSVQFEGCKINRKGGVHSTFASDTHNLDKRKKGIQVLSMCMTAFQAIMWVYGDGLCLAASAPLSQLP